MPWLGTHALSSIPHQKAIQLFNTRMSTLGASVIIQTHSCVAQLAFGGSQQPPVAPSPANGRGGQARRAGGHNEKVTDEYLSPRGKMFGLGFSADWAEQPCSLTPHLRSCNFICAKGCGAAGASAEVMAFQTTQPALAWHLCPLPPQSHLLLVAAHSPCRHQACSTAAQLCRTALLPSFSSCLFTLLYVVQGSRSLLLPPCSFPSF